MAYSKQEQEFLTQLGHNIRKIRESKGWSQEAFALEVGIHRTYYGDIERGNRNVSSLNLGRIVRLLGVEIGDIFPS